MCVAKDLDSLIGRTKVVFTESSHLLGLFSRHISPSIDIRRISSALVYIAFLALAVCAGRLALEGIDARQGQLSSLQHGLKLSKLHGLIEQEKIESDTALKLKAQAKDDRKQSLMLEEDTKKVLGTAEAEKEEALELWKQVNLTDQDRLSLLQNIKEEEHLKASLEETLAGFHEGVCGWVGFHLFCNIVGGMTKLQNDRNRTVIQLDSDKLRLETIENAQALEANVAKRLQATIEKDMIIANDMHQDALKWATRAEKEKAEAKQLEAETDDIQKRIVSLKMILKDAQSKADRGTRFFVGSIFLAAFPLLFFLLRITPVVLDRLRGFLLRTTVRERVQSFVVVILYFSLNALFFLVTAVWCQGILPYMELFSLEMRAVVIAYFSLLAASAHSAFLHGIYHFMIEVGVFEISQRLPTALAIVRHSVLRAIMLTPRYGMEFMLVWWSPIRMRALNPSRDAAVLEHLLLLLLLVVFYFVVPRLRCEISMGSPTDDSSDLTSPEDLESCSATERTPLKGPNSVTATDIVPDLYLSEIRDQRMDLYAADEGSFDSTSPFFVDIRAECFQLALALEVFVAISMLLIICVGIGAVFSGWSFYMLCPMLLPCLFVAKILYGRTEDAVIGTKIVDV